MVHCSSPSSIAQNRALILHTLAILLTFAVPCLAEVDVLIIQPRTGFDGTGIKEQLQKILEGSGLKDVKVALTGPSEDDQKCLSGWYYDPNHDAEKRWSNLQGKGGTAWDYVVIMENPEVIETFPGWYAQGVHDVASEVEKGKGEAVLLMQWPAADSTATLAYYKEVTYRVGRGRGLKVVPAGLAWKAAESPVGKDAAYIAAAGIYSRLWNKSAAESSYRHNDAMAKTVFKTVSDHIGAKQYSGPFTSAPNGIHTMGGNRNRVIRIINDGWRSRGFPLETVDNGNIWNLTRRMGLINRISSKENKGGAHGLSRKGTADDKADLHYIASTGIRDTTAGLYASYLSNYVRNPGALEYAARVKNGYNHDAHSLANRWNAGDKRLRQLPPYLLVSQVFRHFQSYDKKVIDIHVASKPCYASYVVTLLTGRCPMVFEDAGTKAYTLQRIGYETAWRFSTLHGRAPGFKVWPATPLRMTVDPTHDASMQVAFALPPKSDVRVTVSATKSFVKVSPRELIFSPTNYNKPQTVTISVAAGSTAATPFDIVFSTTSDDIVCNELSDSWRYVVNRPPVADSQETTVLSDHVTAIHLSGSDPDDLSVDSGLKPPPPITEPLSYSIARQPANGTVKIAGSVAAYTPKPGFTGADRFTFRTKDFSVHSAEATVAFTVKPTTPFERNLLVNGDGELFPFTDFGWVEKSGTWTQSTDRRHSGQAAFYTDRSSSAELYQDVDITSYSKSIKTGDLSFKFEGYFKRNCNEERRGRMSIVLECRDAAGRVLANSAIDDIPGSGRFDSNPFDKQSVSIKAPANTTVLRVKLIAEKPEGRKNNCYFDALSLVPLKPTRDP